MNHNFPVNENEEIWRESNDCFVSSFGQIKDKNNNVLEQRENNKKLRVRILQNARAKYYNVDYLIVTAFKLPNWEKVQDGVQSKFKIIKINDELPNSLLNLKVISKTGQTENNEHVQSTSSKKVTNKGGTRQYNNLKKCLDEGNLILMTSQEEFSELLRFSIRCEYNHESEWQFDDYMNRRHKKDKDGDKTPIYLLCKTCKQIDDSVSNLESLRTFILKETGHKVISMKDTHNVVYQCGNCGLSDLNTSKRNLLRNSTKCCPKCQNDQFKSDPLHVSNILSLMDLKLVEYLNNKEVICLCTCGSQFSGQLSHLTNGLRCSECNLKNDYKMFNWSSNSNAPKKTTSNKQKSSYHLYTFENGRSELIQGYEKSCLDELIKHHPEKDIVVGQKNVPIIHYKKPLIHPNEYISFVDAKYYPDISLPNQKLIEVKSVCTYTSQLKINKAKFEACQKNGFDLECWIYHNEKKLNRKEFYLRQKDNGQIPEMYFEIINA